MSYALVVNQIHPGVCLNYSWVTGVPFKYERSIATHSRFVQDVQYAPSGEVFVSVGSDAKIFIYDGKTGDTKAELTQSPHKGSIVSLNSNTVTLYRLQLVLIVCCGVEIR
jgi:WD40 repeat protein